MEAMVQGKWQNTIGRDRGYFDQRGVWLDCRGRLIIHERAHFGFEVMLITAAHAFTDEDKLSGAFYRTVRIDEEAYICSRAILYNCHIQHHAVVGAGAVVKSIIVPSFYLADGNPAKLVARWQNGHWLRLLLPVDPPRFTEAVDQCFG